MNKIWVLLVVLLSTPVICVASERYVSIGGVSFHIGQHVRDALSLYEKNTIYKITELDDKQAGYDKMYYISKKDTNEIVGVLKFAKSKVAQITRHWVSGKDTGDEISRALFNSVREYVLMEGANAVISTEENSSPEMTIKNIKLSGKKSSITITTIEGHGDSKYTHMTIYDTVGRQ